MTVVADLRFPGWTSTPDGHLHYWSGTYAAEIPEAILRSQACDANTFGELTGSWAVVDMRGDAPVVAADRTLSRPLYYGKANGNWVITDAIDTFRGLIPWVCDVRHAEVFPHFGYTLGGNTLIQGISLVGAGAYVILGDQSPSSRQYIDYRFSAERDNDSKEYARKFTQALDTVFERVMRSYGKCQFVVPLSGGLDSRLVLSWLKRCGAENILAFSYGRANSEAGIAHSVAESLGIDFVQIDYDYETIHSRWKSTDGLAFRDYSWGGFSLPHIQDWEAVRQLRDHDHISKDSVFLPGHTIVGNMHDDWLLQSNATTADMYDALASHHGDLQGRASLIRHDFSFLETVRDVLVGVKYDGTPASVQAAIEWFNLRERQAKYINNSMRVYEHFGYRWALPMLDREMWSVWLNGSEQFTSTRDWYRQYVNAAFVDAGGMTIDLYDPRRDLTKKYIKTAAVQKIARSSIGPLLDNMRTAMIEGKHPLAFDAFDPPRTRFSRFMLRARGVSRMGEWANAFLGGYWGDGAELFPR